MANLDFFRYIGLIRGSEGINKYVPSSFLPFNYELLNMSPDIAKLNAPDRTLAAPSHDIMNRDAKLWRGALCFAVSEGLGGTVEETLPLAMSLEVMHTASLVIDDVEDKSQVRRGKPCLHLLHNEATALNVGNYMFLLPLLVISKSSFPDPVKLKLMEVMNLEMVKLTVGQGLDIKWAQLRTMPTMEEYLFTVECKTSVMVRLAVKLASIANNASESVTAQLVNYAELIGAAFQIKDDLLNLGSVEYVKGRSYFGEDITEGKRSAIIIRAISQSAHSCRLIDILNMCTTDQVLVSEALDIIRGTDALEWAKNLVEDYAKRAILSLKQANLRKEPAICLEELAEFIVERDK